MNEPAIFKFENNEVRTVMVDGEHWFVGKDICTALDATWSGMRTFSHIPAEWRKVVSVTTHSRGQHEMAVLSEQGLYFFLGRSDKPAALPIQKWIAGEVLPTIRKTNGAYLTSQKAEELLADPKLIIGLAQQVLDLKEKSIGLLSRIEADRYKVEFADTAIKSEKGIPVGDMAKVISQDGEFIIGRNSFYRWMRSQKILLHNNMPKQRYIDNGWLVVDEGFFENMSTNGPVPYFKTLVTGKGQVEILRRFKADPDKHKFLGKSTAALRTNRQHFPVEPAPAVQ